MGSILSEGSLPAPALGWWMRAPHPQFPAGLFLRSVPAWLCLGRLGLISNWGCRPLASHFLPSLAL